MLVRLKLEVAYVEEESQLHTAEVQVATKGKALVVEEEDMALQQGANQTLKFPTLKSFFSRLRGVALGMFAPGNNTARLHGSEESALPACLSVIFRHAVNLEVSSCWLHQLSTGTQHASLLLMHWVIYGFHRKEGDQSFASGVKPPKFACLILWLIYSP
jgi:hypothetical protein